MINLITSVLSIEIFGIDLINKIDFYELVIRFLFNLTIVGVCVGLLYYPKARRKDYVFSYILISMVIFLLCFLLDNVKLQLGFALGLFAIFGIIRYRTDAIPIKEMTYLFLVIGVSVINALANKKVSYAELIFTNFILVIIGVLMEYVVLRRNEIMQVIVYEKINLIHRDKKKELLADLESRTGLKINRIEMGRVNFLRDTVRIKIFYYENHQVDQTLPKDQSKPLENP